MSATGDLYAINISLNQDILIFERILSYSVPAVKGYMFFFRLKNFCGVFVRLTDFPVRRSQFQKGHLDGHLSIDGKDFNVYYR